MVYLDEPNVTKEVLTSEKGRQEVRVRVMQLEKDATGHLKTEEGAMNRGIQGVSRSWKRPGKRFSPTASVQNEQLC